MEGNNRRERSVATSGYRQEETTMTKDCGKVEVKKNYWSDIYQLKKVEEE